MHKMCYCRPLPETFEQGWMYRLRNRELDMTYVNTKRLPQMIHDQIPGAYNIGYVFHSSVSDAKALTDLIGGMCKEKVDTRENHVYNITLNHTIAAMKKARDHFKVKGSKCWKTFNRVLVYALRWPEKEPNETTEAFRDRVAGIFKSVGDM